MVCVRKYMLAITHNKITAKLMKYTVSHLKQHMNLAA